MSKNAAVFVLTPSTPC